MLDSIFITIASMRKNNIDPVNNFDLEHYLGKWYEIARLPNKFEDGLEEITAEYFKNADGSVKVVNSGYSVRKHKRIYSFGNAKFVDNPKKAHLLVRFIWPFKAYYKIIFLDDNYQCAVVVCRGYKSLWILSRTPYLDLDILHDMLNKCLEWKFNTQNLIYPLQNIHS
jgi:apolipoprotein D and lipocalin family protein